MAYRQAHHRRLVFQRKEYVTNAGLRQNLQPAQTIFNETIIRRACNRFVKDCVSHFERLDRIFIDDAAGNDGAGHFQRAIKPVNIDSAQPDLGNLLGGKRL